MQQKIYPRWLRAVHIREDMALITIKNTPDGAWENLIRDEDAELLLGSPRDGWLRAAVPMAAAERIAQMYDVSVVPYIRLMNIYGTEMRGMCLPILRALEEAGAQVLGISLSTQRMSAAVLGDVSAIDVLVSRFPMEL